MRPEDLHVQTLYLQEQLRVQSRRTLSKFEIRELQHYQVKTRMDEILDEQVIELQRLIYGREVHEEREETGERFVPLDWWQHFKQRWFPRWAQKRWPVQVRRIVTGVVKKYHRVCPHLELPPDRREHTLFLMDDSQIELRPKDDH